MYTIDAESIDVAGGPMQLPDRWLLSVCYFSGEGERLFRLFRMTYILTHYVIHDKI